MAMKTTPKKLMDFPEYAELFAKRDGLRIQKTEIETQISKVYEDLAKAKGRGTVAEQAEALLSGEDLEAQLREMSAHERALRGNLDELHDRKRVVDRALGLLSDRIEKLQQKLSGQVLTAHQAERRQKLQRVADAYAELCVALDEQRALDGEFRSGDVITNSLFRAVPVGGVHLSLKGDAHHGAAYQWLKEAVETCGITIPPAAREMMKRAGMKAA